MLNQESETLHERWELASQAAQEGIWDWDLKTNKVYRSNYWFKMFGYEPGELPDNPWAWEKIIHPEDVARVLEIRHDHIEGRSDRYYVEHRVLCKDGQFRWFLSRGQVVRNEQGLPVRLLGFYSNIQADVELREKLQRQNNALDILNQLSLEAIANRDHDLLLTELLNRSRDFMKADKAYLYLLDKTEDFMRMHSLCGSIGPSIMKVRRGEFMIGRTWEAGEYQYQACFDQWPGRPPDSRIKTGLGIPIKWENTVVGIITMGFEQHRSVPEDEVVILRQFAALASRILQRRENIQFSSIRPGKSLFGPVTERQFLRTALLNDLIDGKSMTARELADQSRKLGLSVNKPFLVIVGQWDELAYLLAAEKYLLTIPDCCGWQRDGSLFLLHWFNTIPRNKKESIERIEEVLQRCEIFSPEAGCRVGISLPCSHLRESAQAFQQAVEAVRIGVRLHPQKYVHHYLDIGLIHVLSRQKDRGQIEGFLHYTLGKLVEYDQRKRGRLIETLEMILRETNFREAAEAMSVHPKTLLFRKNKIEEILGESLEDPVVRMNLLMALQLNELDHGK